MGQNIAQVRDLHIKFPSSKTKNEYIEVVRGVSFDIPAKKIVGFIGESGSGKSVTAKSLLGINANARSFAKQFLIDKYDGLVESGKITESKKFFKNIRGKKVAYIPQDSLTSLNPTMKIGKQIIESITLHRPEIKKHSEKVDLAVELLERFGMEKARNRLKAFPHEFSGGMRQRVVIAMTVASKPDIIIADEPTTALDPTIQASVLKLFQEIVKEFKTSILFISHDISVIANLCDYINVFYAGRIVERGTKKEIFTNPKHPYTWALLASMPELSSQGEKLFSLQGQPPDFENLPSGDPFSIRNKFALKIDFKEEPPLFEITKTHWAATWLAHPKAPKAKPPKVVVQLIKKLGKEF